MRTGILNITFAICFFLMAGCISSTTGSITEPVRNDEAAADLNYQLGARYYQQGSYKLARDRLLLATELARESYEKAVRAAPKDFSVQNTYAVFLCRQQEYDEAQKYFDKAASHPENDNAELTMTNAGVCMGQKPDLVAAEKYFRMALDRKSSYGEALLQMCLLKYQSEDYLSARAFLQRYMSGNVPTAGVLYLASRIEDLLGNDRGRTEFEDRLIREFPTSSEAGKVLGSG